jgi:hypothetical protein
MSQDLVRYSPGIERADLDFVQHLDTVLRHLKQNIKTSVEAEAIQRARTTGCVRAGHARQAGKKARSSPSDLRFYSG